MALIATAMALDVSEKLVANKAFVLQNLEFIRLNKDWSAAPNAPYVDVKFSGSTAILSFLLNSFAYEADAGEKAEIGFVNCSRWNWDATNDHAWFAGQGRYAKEAPEWGEFYEVRGEEPLGGTIDWEVISPDSENARHFLFYFRDETLEFIATDWSMTRRKA